MERVSFSSKHRWHCTILDSSTEFCRLTGRMLPLYWSETVPNLYLSSLDKRQHSKFLGMRRTYPRRVKPRGEIIEHR